MFIIIKKPIKPKIPFNESSQIQKSSSLLLLLPLLLAPQPLPDAVVFMSVFKFQQIKQN